MDQLDSIGLDGKQVSNRLALADLLKDQSSNVQERDAEPSSGDKVAGHKLQIEDISEGNNVTPILEDTGGQVQSLPPKQKPVDSVEHEQSAEDPSLEHEYQDGEKKKDAHKADGSKDHDKPKNRRPKLSFEELLAKYEKIGKANIANRSNKVQSSRSPPKYKFQERNWQGYKSHAAAAYYPFEQSVPMSYKSQPTYFHSYSPWGWFDEEAHVPSYFEPQHVKYAAHTNLEKSSSYKDRFDQNRSGAQPKKKAVKQVYRVKYDGRKKKSSDLDATIEKPITLLKNPAIDGKEVRKSSIVITGTKSVHKEVQVSKTKQELPLSKIKTKPKSSFGLPKWQERKL
jgi:hypothetical protein